MSGSQFDLISLVNSNITEYNDKYNRDKPYAIGFEKDREHKNRIRFFDKDGKTVWLPDKLYKELNDFMLRNKNYQTTYVSGYWKQIASGKYIDVSHMLRQKYKALKTHVVEKYKSLFSAKR